MIGRQELLKDLKGLLKRLEKDLRERAEEHGDAPEIHGMLHGEYRKAKKAERTAASFEEWRAEQITQKSAAWILSCVFVRFLEDNRLVDPPKIAGPGERLQIAMDEHELYFRQFPTHSDRDYLLQAFEDLARLPGGEEIFGRHNAIHVFPGWLSGDAAGELLEFFQKIEPETGWLKKEPGANSRELAGRTFTSIYGVDITPFAVAIAKFRLLLKAMKACDIAKLENCPNFKLHLACGDSLLHGEVQQQLGLPFEGVKHWYQTEDAQILKVILKKSFYHAVVANPPYITPKEVQQNQNIR